MMDMMAPDAARIFRFGPFLGRFGPRGVYHDLALVWIYIGYAPGGQGVVPDLSFEGFSLRVQFHGHFSIFCPP